MERRLGAWALAILGATWWSASSSDLGEVSGTILVDGQPPEWPIYLYLQSSHVSVTKAATEGQPRIYADSITVTPLHRGAFSFQSVPREKLSLQVGDFHFADGGSTLELDGPTSGVVLQLESKPEIVGRILDPEGRPASQVSGECELRVGPTHETLDQSVRRSFQTRTDGRFRMPGEALGEWAAVTLLVEQGNGYLLHGTPALARAPRLDLGDLRLEPVRELRFTVRDPSGSAIPQSFAELYGPRWEDSGPPLTVDGNGVLSNVPARPVDVRFGAHRYVERILRVGLQETIEVVLQPLATLEVRLVDPDTHHVTLVAERSAFDWDRTAADEAVEHCDRHWQGASFRRSPSATDRRFVYEIAPKDATLALVGLTPDLVLTLDARDWDGNVLATATVSVAFGEHAALELGTPDPSGELPIFGGQAAGRRPRVR